VPKGRGDVQAAPLAYGMTHQLTPAARKDHGSPRPAGHGAQLHQAVCGGLVLLVAGSSSRLRPGQAAMRL